MKIEEPPKIELQTPPPTIPAPVKQITVIKPEEQGTQSHFPEASDAGNSNDGKLVPLDLGMDEYDDCGNPPKPGLVMKVETLVVLDDVVLLDDSSRGRYTPVNDSFAQALVYPARLNRQIEKFTGILDAVAMGRVPKCDTDRFGWETAQGPSLNPPSTPPQGTPESPPLNPSSYTPQQRAVESACSPTPIADLMFTHTSSVDLSNAFRYVSINRCSTQGSLSKLMATGNSWHKFVHADLRQRMSPRPSAPNFGTPPSDPYDSESLAPTPTSIASTPLRGSSSDSAPEGDSPSRGPIVPVFLKRFPLNS